MSNNFMRFSSAPDQLFDTIRKRDQRHEPFDASKITKAILKAGRASGEFEETEARRLTMVAVTSATLLTGTPAARLVETRTRVVGEKLVDERTDLRLQHLHEPLPEAGRRDLSLRCVARTPRTRSWVHRWSWRLLPRWPAANG